MRLRQVVSHDTLMAGAVDIFQEHISSKFNVLHVYLCGGAGAVSPLGRESGSAREFL